MKTGLAASLGTSLALGFCTLAQADFSYTQTRKMTGGVMAGMAGGMAPQASKISMKGQKMKTADANTATILDLEAQTITTINNAQKTYTVQSLVQTAASAGDLDVKADLKETGQKKTVNGFNADETIMTMDVDAPQMGKMQMEIDMWLSKEVPGMQEMRSFYTKNGDKLPWRALAGGGNPGMASAIAQLQKKMATMNAVPVQQIIRMKAPDGMAGGRGAPALSASQASQMQSGMEQARKQLEAMVAQGGMAATIAKKQLDRMGPAPGVNNGAGGSASSNWLFEMTLDSTEFSSADIPDATFAIPAGFQKN